MKRRKRETPKKKKLLRKKGEGKLTKRHWGRVRVIQALGRTFLIGELSKEVDSFRQRKRRLATKTTILIDGKNKSTRNIGRGMRRGERQKHAGRGEEMRAASIHFRVGGGTIERTPEIGR